MEFLQFEVPKLCIDIMVLLIPFPIEMFSD